MALNDSSSGTLVTVVMQAWRRCAQQIAIQEVLLGLTIAFAGPTLLLTLGADSFPLWLLWVFLLLGIAVAGYRWTRFRPKPYEVAQRLDSRWAAEDQISTAYYFSKNPARAGVLAKEQLRLAESVAGAGDLPAALPFQVPTTAYSLAAMTLLVLGLAGLRFAVQRTLSLEPPLARLVKQALLGQESEKEPPEEPPKESLQPGREPAPTLTEEAALDRDTRRQTAEPFDESAQDHFSNDPSAESELPLPEVEGLSLDDDYGDELAAKTAGNEGNSEGMPEGVEEMTDPSGNSSNAENPKQDDSKRKADSMNEESGSLLSRLQEAFQNMLSALNLDQPSAGENAEQGGQSQQTSEQSADSSQTGGGQAQQAEQGAGESQSGGEGSTDSPAELTQGQGGDESSDQGPQGLTTASAGSNDGSKEISETELLQAMGELNELYNRRAAEMSGEVMIETESARQNLQTPYQATKAGHQDPGGTVSRDEIPLAYRSFIQTYFQNLRQKNKN